MGSMIYLSLGNLELDWGKNSGFADHSPLFQPGDVALIPYYYADDVVEQKEGLSKPLGQAVKRIDLLGHSLRMAEKEFHTLSKFNNFSTETFPFEALSAALRSVDVKSLAVDYEDQDIEKFFRREIFPRLQLENFLADPRTAQFEAALGMENMSAYSIIQLLAQNPQNLNLPVCWRFADVEEGGWAERGFFVHPLDVSNRFLIVTEGSSDAAILKKAFALLRPGIADFFTFVDMEEGYPFSGTGNLFRFVQGLVSIAIQNSILIVFDNDAEGVASYQRTRALNLPSNMEVLKLPDLPEFSNFRTIGPSGLSIADINGRAAAIECYLDVGSEPLIQWTNYIESTQTYHGALMDKRNIMKTFLDLRSVNSHYDFHKLELLLDHIVSACVQMREESVEGDLDRTIPFQ